MRNLLRTLHNSGDWLKIQGGILHAQNKKIIYFLLISNQFINSLIHLIKKQQETKKSNLNVMRLFLDWRMITFSLIFGIYEIMDNAVNRAYKCVV